jgi:hypothetical protein
MVLDKRITACYTPPMSDTPQKKLYRLMHGLPWLTLMVYGWFGEQFHWSATHWIGAAGFLGVLAPILVGWQYPPKEDNQP